MLDIFRKKLYIKARKDTDEELKIKGTPYPALVRDIRKEHGGYVIECSPQEGVNYDEQLFFSKPSKILPKVRIGGIVTVWVDEFDGDGQYYVEVPL
jgi:hypothetical protein